MRAGRFGERPACQYLKNSYCTVKAKIVCTGECLRCVADKKEQKGKKK